MMKPLGRLLFQLWAQTNVAPGLRYRCVESFGSSLAAPQRLPRQLPNGLVIECDLNDHVERSIWFFGSYEPIESYIFCRLLEPGMVVIDAGANIGQYSLLAAATVNPGGTVHSFEPVEANFQRLAAHIALNRLENVRINQAALWEQDIQVTMHQPESKDSNAGTYSVNASNGSEGTIPALQLDGYVRRQGLARIDLIKMDIEGAELAALKGAMSTLEQFGPGILMEINREALIKLGASPEQIWQLLVRLGYQGWSLVENVLHALDFEQIQRTNRTNALFFRSGLPRPLQEMMPATKNILRWALSCGSQ